MKIERMFSDILHEVGSSLVELNQLNIVWATYPNIYLYYNLAKKNHWHEIDLNDPKSFEKLKSFLDNARIRINESKQYDP